MRRLRAAGLTALAGAAVATAGVGHAGAQQGSGEGQGPAKPRILSITVKQLSSRTIDVAVRARDRDGTVTDIDIDFGDRRGVNATNFCQAFADGKPGPHTGETITFRRIRHTYARTNRRYKLRVKSAVAELPRTDPRARGTGRHQVLPAQEEPFATTALHRLKTKAKLRAGIRLSGRYPALLLPRLRPAAHRRHLPDR